MGLEYIWVNVLSLLVNNFTHTEFDIWNIISCGLYENRDDVLSHLVSLYVWHHSSQGAEAAHSEIVSFFLSIEVSDHIWNIFVHDPISLEVLGQNCTLFDSHFSNTCGCVCQISHEDSLKMLAKYFLSENETKFSNKLQDCHPYPPLTFFGHIGESLDQRGCQHVRAGNSCDLHETFYYVQLDFRALILYQLQQNRHNLTSGVIFSNYLSHLTNSKRSTSLKLSSRIGICVFEGR